MVFLGIDMPRKVEISHKTVIFTVLFLILLWFLYFIRDIIFMVFVALLLMTILNPLVTRLSRFKIPRVVSLLIVYVLVVFSIVLTMAALIPPLIEQTTNFASGLPAYLQNLPISSKIGDQIYDQILSQVVNLPGQIIGFGVTLVSNIINIITVLILAFYFLLARDRLDDQLLSYLGKERALNLGKIIDELEVKLGGWARGQIALMFVIGIFNFIGLTILGIPFALPLSIFAGLVEIVPYMGPIIGAVPAVIIGLGISPVVGLATIAFSFLNHQLENYVFAPKIIQKSVGVAPIITLVALAVGLKVAGVTGVLISVPIVITVQVLVKRYYLQ